MQNESQKRMNSTQFTLKGVYYYDTDVSMHGEVYFTPTTKKGEFQCPVVNAADAIIGYIARNNLSGREELLNRPRSGYCATVCEINPTIPGQRNFGFVPPNVVISVNYIDVTGGIGTGRGRSRNSDCDMIENLNLILFTGSHAVVVQGVSVMG